MNVSTDRAAQVSGPLAGVKVVEYGDPITAPYSAKILADLGADVLKIEPPVAGDRSRLLGPYPNDVPDPEHSGLFIYLNSGKRGITLDLESPSGRDIFDKIVAGADVLIENVIPADSERLGLDHDRISAISEDVIHLSVTPFGHNGPYSTYQGTSLNVGAMSGVVLGNGNPGQPPLPLPDFLEDFFTGVVGAMSCLLAVAGADMQEGGKRGEWIDLNASEAWMTYQTGLGVVSWLFSGRRIVREGRRHRGGPYPYTIMPCKDGEVRLIAMTKREWMRFVGVMDNPEWAADPKYQDRLKMNELYADELDALIQPWIGARTKAELLDTFYNAGVPFTPVNDFGDVLNDPQLNYREFFATAEQPNVGTLKVPGPPYRFLNEPLPGWRPAPALGQHNAEVYTGELGMSRQELVQLRQAGVI